MNDSGVVGVLILQTIFRQQLTMQSPTLYPPPLTIYNFILYIISSSSSRWEWCSVQTGPFVQRRGRREGVGRDAFLSPVLMARWTLLSDTSWRLLTEHTCVP